MNKTYTRINWQNAPSEATALNDVNLNKMDSAIDTIDDRVVTHDTQITNAESAISTLQSDKVDKVEGKGLSTEDYTTAEKTKLSGIAANATSTEFIRTYSSGIGIGTYRKNATYTTVNIPAPDTELSSASTNYVQNKTVTSALAGKVDKESNKGLFNLSTMSFLDNTSYTGDEVAYITYRSHSQDPSEPDLNFAIYNGMVAISNAEIDALE